MKKWIWGLAIVLLGATIFLPMPQRITRDLKGFVLTDSSGDEGKICSIKIDGTKYNYVLKPDVYIGKFAISTDARTTRATHLNTFVERGYISHMTYLTDQG